MKIWFDNPDLHNQMKKWDFCCFSIQVLQFSMSGWKYNTILEDSYNAALFLRETKNI